MPTKPVPRDCENPIAFLVGQGWTQVGLAAAWGLKTTSTIEKMKAFRHVPRLATAQKMAATFGWNSGGQVIDFWYARQQARYAHKTGKKLKAAV